MIETPRTVDSPKREAAVIHLTIPRAEIRHVMGPSYKELMDAVAAQGITPSGPWFSHHFRMDPATFDFEIGVPVPKPVKTVGRVKPGDLPAAKVIRTVYHGGYEGLPAAWGEFDAWIKTNGVAVSGELWEIYTVGPETTKDPAAIRTELSRPLATT